MRVVIAGTIQSPKVSSARSSGNSCTSAHSRRTDRRDESSVNTSTSSSIQTRGIYPTDISAQSSSNFAGNHASSRYNQCVYKTQASSLPSGRDFIGHYPVQVMLVYGKITFGALFALTGCARVAQLQLRERAAESVANV